MISLQIHADYPVRAGVSGIALAFTLMLTGCSTVDRIKEAVSPDTVPATAKGPASATRKSPAAPASPGIAKAPSRDEAAASGTNIAAQLALSEGIELYEKGQFNAAIRRLNAPELDAAGGAMQLKALKYKAFSYCVTSRQALCRQQFERALRIDPSFELELGEKGHPLWGPVFERARTGKS